MEEEAPPKAGPSAGHRPGAPMQQAWQGICVRFGGCRGGGVHCVKNHLISHFDGLLRVLQAVQKADMTG